MPKGMPTPMPIFCPLVRPPSSAEGAIGTVAALGVADEVDEVDVVLDRLDANVDADEDVEEVEDALLGEPVEDLVRVEKVTVEDTSVVALLDADVAVDRIALLRAGVDAESDDLEDWSVGVDNGDDRTDLVGVTETPVVCTVPEGHAV